MAAQFRQPRNAVQLDSKANIRAALGCGQYERTVDAARRVAAERDALKQKVADLEAALRWTLESDNAAE